MKRRITGLVLLLCAVSFAGEEPAFTTLKAKDALRAYKLALAKLDADYQSKLDVARRAYIASLKEAVRNAGTAGNVDEMVKIDKRIKALEAEVKKPTDSHAPSREPLVIDSAIYWAGDISEDLTPSLRARLSNGVIHGADVMTRDIKGGFHKWLIVKARYHGQVLWFTVGDDMSKFSLGTELTKEWQADIAGTRLVK